MHFDAVHQTNITVVVEYFLLLLNISVKFNNVQNVLVNSLNTPVISEAVHCFSCVRH